MHKTFKIWSEKNSMQMLKLLSAEKWKETRCAIRKMAIFWLNWCKNKGKKCLRGEGVGEWDKNWALIFVSFSKKWTLFCVILTQSFSIVLFQRNEHFCVIHTQLLPMGMKRMGEKRFRPLGGGREFSKERGSLSLDKGKERVLDFKERRERVLILG